MASVMLLLRHRARLVEELLEANVVDAQDVPADVEGFRAMREVGQYSLQPGARTERAYTRWQLLIAHDTDNEPSFSRP